MARAASVSIERKYNIRKLIEARYPEEQHSIVRKKIMDRLKIDRRQLSAWEVIPKEGKRDISVHYLKGLADFFVVQMEDLINE